MPTNLQSSFRDSTDLGLQPKSLLISAEIGFFARSEKDFPKNVS